jgi:hypothetical protein
MDRGPLLNGQKVGRSTPLSPVFFIRKSGLDDAFACDPVGVGKSSRND